jgi:hypothetical protein
MRFRRRIGGGREPLRLSMVILLALLAIAVLGRILRSFR